MQAGLVEHHDEKDSQQNPNDSQRPASVHQQAQRIPTVNITEATRSINQPPRRTHPQRPPCWQCVQPNPKPYRQPCGFLFILVIPFPVMRPFLWSVAAGNPIRSSWKQPNIRHLNPRQTTLGNSMELHHDPFLSFALSGYNHEWYGTVHAHHASLSFPICMENIFG